MRYLTTLSQFSLYGSRLTILWAIMVYGSRLIIDWTIYGPDYGQAGTINFAFLWNMAYHRLDHICPEYGQPGIINLYGPEYDQPGIILYDGRVWLTCFCMGGKPGLSFRSIRIEWLIRSCYDFTTIGVIVIIIIIIVIYLATLQATSSISDTKRIDRCQKSLPKGGCPVEGSLRNWKIYKLFLEQCFEINLG